MNMALKALSVLNKDETVRYCEVKSRIEEKEQIVLNASQQSDIRKKLFMFSDSGMVQKEEIGKKFWYTLVKDKSEYQPPRPGGYREKRTIPKIEISPGTRLEKIALHWWSCTKVGIIENLLKSEFGFTEYRKASKEQIITLYEKYSLTYPAKMVG